MMNNVQNYNLTPLPTYNECVFMRSIYVRLEFNHILKVVEFLQCIV